MAGIDIANMKSWALGLLPSGDAVMFWLKAGIIIVCCLVLLGAAWLFYYHKTKKAKSNSANIQLCWWRDVNGQLKPEKAEQVIEVFIPNANLRLFHNPETETWYPRFTREIEPGRFYLALSPNKNVVNFSLKSIGQDMLEAGLDYDHTDNLWAAENVREWVKRNYIDNATPWYERFAGLITGVTYILVTTFCLAIFLWLWKGLAVEMSASAKALGDSCMILLQKAAEAAPSGVAQLQ